MSIVDPLLSGDRRALAKAITSIENDEPEAGKILSKVYPMTGRALLVGVTGPPGTGKSTLVDATISEYRSQGRTVGVLAIDPTSPFTGGAILGDRVRMIRHSGDGGVFIRSMATRGDRGGLARATKNAIRLLDALGNHVVIVETVGSGQLDLDVANAVDVTVVVFMPGMGDEVQSLKAGLMEIGDIFVVNKADLPAADRLVLDLRNSVQERRGWRPQVLKTVALTGEGVRGLTQAIDGCKSFLLKSGIMDKLVRERIEREVIDLAKSYVLKRLDQDLSSSANFRSLMERTLAKEIYPDLAARELVDKILS